MDRWIKVTKCIMKTDEYMVKMNEQMYTCILQMIKWVNITKIPYLSNQPIKNFAACKTVAPTSIHSNIELLSSI